MNKAVVNKAQCVACGACAKVCTKRAITIIYGIYADVNEELCVGCKRCQRTCPASVIEVVPKGAAS